MKKLSNTTLNNINSENKTSKTLDKYYTAAQTVATSFSYLKNIFEQNGLNINDYNFLEPCAGAGAFLNEIESKYINSKYEAYDILPEDKRIKKADFLEITKKYNESYISIGNPPFGYKGDLAVAFINKCSLITPIVAFILPIQFRRFNIQKHISNELKLVFSSDDFPKKSFVLDKKPYTVNCLFQIWVRKDFKPLKNLLDIRHTKPLPNKHEDFKLFIHNNTQGTLKFFDKEKYGWDFAVPRQGFYDYNNKITNPQCLRKNVQYLFVKYINPIAYQVFNKIDFEKLSHVNTSILGFSNTDLVQEYIKIKAKLINERSSKEEKITDKTNTPSIFI